MPVHIWPVPGQHSLRIGHVCLCRIKGCQGAVTGRYIVVGFNLQQKLSLLYVIAVFDNKVHNFTGNIGGDFNLGFRLNFAIGGNDLCEIPALGILRLLPCK